MDVMKFAKIRNEQGTVTSVIPIGVDSSHVDVTSDKNLDVVLAEKTDLLDLASQFDPQTVYSRGDYVIQDNKLWRLTNNHSSGVAWSSTSKQEIKLADDVKDLFQVSNTQPAGSANKVWIDSSSEQSIQIPTYDDFVLLKNTLIDAISDPWVSGKEYKVGDYCTTNNLLYQCRTNHTSSTSFSTSYWTQVMSTTS